MAQCGTLVERRRAANVHFADCQRTLRQRTCCIALRQSFVVVCLIVSVGV